MGKKDYLLCHPKRVFVRQNCEVLKKSNDRWANVSETENVVIPVDSLIGNQDPYVFHQPWFYGYCRNANVSADTGPQSIFVFGTYDTNTACEKFLVDTVFVVNRRYFWLNEDNNYLPSKEFRNSFSYSERDKWYHDFISPRVDYHVHPKAKFIFEAKHFKHYSDVFPDKRIDQFFSFIPLNFEDGIYKLVDILPIIQQYDKSFFSNYTERRNRLYSIDAIMMNIVTSLFKGANRLVVNTTQVGSPVELDKELQRTYYRFIYGITNDEEIENEIEQWCFSNYDPFSDDGHL